MIAPIVHWHLFANEAGETHLVTVDVELRTFDFAPPALPMGLSDAISATAYTWSGGPDG